MITEFTPTKFPNLGSASIHLNDYPVTLIYGALQGEWCETKTGRGNAKEKIVKEDFL